MFKRLAGLLALTIVLISGAAAEKYINLPKPDQIGKYPLESSITIRRSQRDFEDRELTMEQISQLLWAGQGITDREFGFRTAPSAGALYPITLYLVKKDGVFRYLPDRHRLVEIEKGDKRPEMVRAALGQGYIREAPISIVLAANFRITESKFGARTFRYVCMEAGHIAQNIQLQAGALGLATCPTGSFWDDVVKSALKLPEPHDPIYILPIGYPKPTS
jgi:SagB-type dehydrogenase family enzyme